MRILEGRSPRKRPKKVTLSCQVLTWMGTMPACEGLTSRYVLIVASRASRRVESLVVTYLGRSIRGPKLPSPNTIPQRWRNVSRSDTVHPILSTWAKRRRLNFNLLR